MIYVGTALIVQNKGGGHGEIGFALCNQLWQSDPNLRIVVLQEGKFDETSSPFSTYELRLC